MTAGRKEIVPEQLSIPDRSDDLVLLKRLETAILKSTKGSERFKKEIPLLLRRAIDEVIDAPRTGRFTVDELEKTEKTYLGTKVEILLRNRFRFPKGKSLDLSIDGIDVDVKNTMGDNWMIPREAVGRACLLVKTDEKRALFSVGIIVARVEFLHKGANQDGKRGFSAAGKTEIHWILRDEPYPENFWQGISEDLRRKIASQPSGTKRVDVLFRSVLKRPISRSQVLAVAAQRDAMKRLRKNGGARDSLAKDKIALLSGYFDKKLIEELKLPKCAKDEFISFAPTTDSELQLLRKSLHLK